MRGWKMSKMPEQYRQQKALKENQLQGAQLANALKQMQLKQAPQMSRLNQEYKQAQIQSLLRPKTYAPDPFVKALAAQKIVQEQYGSDSPQAKLMSERLNLMAKGQPGFSFTTDKDGNVSLSQGAAALPNKNLPKGYQVWKDEQGKPGGYLIPSTPAELKEHKGRSFFNHVQPLINQGLSPYSGRVAEVTFTRDAKNYGRDPEATQRIDDFLLARKLFGAGLVKENATIGGSNTRYGYQTLQDTLDSSNLLPIVETVGKKLLPSSALQKAGKRMNEVINQATNVSTRNLPAYTRTYFNPKNGSAGKRVKKNQDLDVTDKVAQAAQSMSVQQLNEKIAELEKRGG